MRPNLKSSAILVPDPVSLSHAKGQQIRATQSDRDGYAYKSVAKRLRTFKRTGRVGQWQNHKVSRLPTVTDRGGTREDATQGLVKHSIPGQLTSVSRWNTV